MINKLILSILLCSMPLLWAAVSDNVHTFYYGWYGNKETDGALRHWDHEIINANPPQKYPGGDDIGANYLPQLGNYSSNDTSLIKTHMEQLVSAGTGVITVSWWGKDSFEDKGLARLMDIAARYGIKVNFHLEPFYKGNADTVRSALVYLLNKFGTHPALYKAASLGNRPLVYIYDSYTTSNTQWARLFKQNGDITVRGTAYDVVAIGLWVNSNDGTNILSSYFDGFYTYFATNGFTWGSTTTNWTTLANWAKNNQKLFIPSVGPGYIDTRIRPWNAVNTRSRENGAYYDRMFQAAINTQAPIISVTSFNEWHEGTQIEPAVPKSITNYTYENYLPNQPDYYLERTNYWVQQFLATSSKPNEKNPGRRLHAFKIMRYPLDKTIKILWSDFVRPQELYVYAASGAPLKQNTTALHGGEFFILDLSGCGAGVYYIKAVFDGKNIVREFILF